MADHHHTISGLVGKLVTELEVNCNPNEYYKIFKHHEDLPNAIPHIYRCVKAVEGGDITSEGKPLSFKERSTYDDESRTIHHSTVEEVLLDDYKKFDATLVVNPKANRNGSIVSWIVEYEMINEDSPVPISYLADFHNIIEDLNIHLCASD
ncbi:major latex protein 22-like [Papaver somniferum]|uniref:major latex protein 22-like n=1 Tax=Papaver somniferum TaxID=3469 RepID=UPI000E702E87|nr:major latex protein 22-like [Papaver somniferum]